MPLRQPYSPCAVQAKPIRDRRLNILPTTLIILGSATVVSAVIVAVMIKVGPTDRPNARSSHQQPVPKGGGLGPVIVTLIVLAFLSWSFPHSHELLSVMCGSLIVAVMALIDDVQNLSFKIKLAAQAAAAALVVAGGASVSQIGPVPLGVFGPVLTFCWIVYVTNAVNFMDGINGLVGGTCAIVGLTLLGWDGAVSKLVALVLACGLIGFLPFNFPRARIFLGDVGSQFCGFILAVLSITQWQENEASGLALPLALLVLLFDVGVTLVRRLLAGERLTDAHRGHSYQLLHRSGVPAVWVTAGVWALSAWGAACAAWATWYAAIPLASAPLVIWTAWAWRRARARLESW